MAAKLFFRYETTDPWVSVSGSNLSWTCNSKPTDELLYKILYANNVCSGIQPSTGCVLQPALTSSPLSVYKAIAVTEDLPNIKILAKLSSPNGLQPWYTSTGGYWIEWRHFCGCKAYTGDTEQPVTRIRTYPNLQGNFANQEVSGARDVWLYRFFDTPTYRFEVFDNANKIVQLNNPTKCPQVVFSNCPPGTACECTKDGTTCCYDALGNVIYSF